MGVYRSRDTTEILEKVAMENHHGEPPIGGPKQAPCDRTKRPKGHWLLAGINKDSEDDQTGFVTALLESERP